MDLAHVILTVPFDLIWLISLFCALMWILVSKIWRPKVGFYSSVQSDFNGLIQCSCADPRDDIQYRKNTTSDDRKKTDICFKCKLDTVEPRCGCSFEWRPCFPCVGYGHIQSQSTLAKMAIVIWTTHARKKLEEHGLTINADKASSACHSWSIWVTNCHLTV